MILKKRKLSTLGRCKSYLGLAVFSVALFSTFGCSVKSSKCLYSVNNLSSERLQQIIDHANDTIYLGAGELYLNSAIHLKANTHIKGDSTVVRYDQSQRINFIRANNQSNISLQNLSIQPVVKAIHGSSVSMGSRTSNNSGYYPIKMLNVDGLKLVNVAFRNQLNTAVALYDVSNVEIVNCSFNNIGAGTTGKKYSYDGIFIGAYRQGTDGVVISGCQFEDIGVEDDGTNDFVNDGDGVQLYTKKSKIENVLISNCLFRNIARRGVKVQSGSDIKIIGNEFDKCNVAIGVSMENSTRKVVFDDNFVSNCNQGVNTNSRKGKPCIVNGLSVSGNRFENLKGVLRTSGSSAIIDGHIADNRIENIATYVFSGRMSNTNIKGNEMLNYQISPIESSNAAIYVWNGSSNTTISENHFSISDNSVLDVYLYKDTRDIIVEGNASLLGNKIRRSHVVDRSLRNKVKN